MINKYISTLVEEGYLHKQGINSKNMRYYLTKEGEELRSYLLLSYSYEIIKLHEMIKNEFEQFFLDLSNGNIKNVVFYGAGEVAEVGLRAIENTDINLAAIVDDDDNKQNKYIGKHKIISPDIISKLKFECIVITSFSFKNEIYNKISYFEEKGIIIRCLQV